MLAKRLDIEQRTKYRAPRYKIVLIVLWIVSSAISSIENLHAAISNNKDTTAQNKATKANYAKVFPQDKVNRIDLVIKAEDWKKMMAELDSNLGAFNKGPMHGFMMPPNGERPDSMHKFGDRPFPMPPFGGEFGEMPPPEFEGRHDTSAFPRPFPGKGIMPFSNDFTPSYMPCGFLFEGQQWNSVGIRFKGNSSLRMAWPRGIKKLPFRLEFNKFRDSTSKVKSQSFYGFRKLSFSSNNNDNSLLREKVAADLFREAGIKAAHTAFYQVYINYGEGPIYFGLYTAVEIIEDTMLKDQFGSASGNCYKPEGRSASFSGAFDTESFEKKTNKKDSDWTDIKTLFTVLNANTRKTNPSLWKSELDSIFDVPAFINWLAVNNTIQNWDTYGQMSHNYYLYNNPSTKKLVWIPWDNNEALMGNRRRNLSFSLSEIKNNWPLIRYLLDQPEYYSLYKASVEAVATKVFEPAKMKAKYQSYYDLIEPYVIGKQGEIKGYTFLTSPDDFKKALNNLKEHVDKRALDVKSYLGY